MGAIMTGRREFLSTIGLVGAGLAFPRLAACAQEPSPQPPPKKSSGAERVAGKMLTRKIPSTGQALPVIGVGTSGSYEVPLTSAEYKSLETVLRVFFEGGGSVIDTSPNYSNAEDVVGALLAGGGWRDQTFLATKLAADDRAALEHQWADSLRRLRVERVELLQVHNLRNLDQALGYARELKARGLTRYIGITHYLDSAQAEVARVLRAERPDFVQINYSVQSPRAADTVFPVAQELGVAVLVNRAFEDGRLFTAAQNRALPAWAAEIGVTSWAQMFLKFAISHSAVTAVIPATGKPERQADNLRAGVGPLLDARQQSELRAMFA
ncbi:aldo/keto reductase [Sphingomonas sp.]|uniref:aldo/keto reductase n=1 Tax=Sphingomonas sp. TaxID=28214 RepID=UPI002FCB7FFE